MNPQVASFEITIHKSVKGDEIQVDDNIGGTYVYYTFGTATGKKKK